MILRNCNSLEQVVAEDKEFKDVIAFENLEVLEFECLPALKMFCSASYCLLELPWLEEVVISNCPRMGIFSLGKTEAPTLKKVLTQKEDGKEHWQGDLNATVNEIFQDMADQVVDTTKREITNLLSSSDDRQQKEDVSSTYPQDAEIHGTIQTDQDMESLDTTRITEESHGSSPGIQEMCDTLKKPSTSIAQNVPSSSSDMIPDAATTYLSPSQAPELATAQSIGLTKGTQEMGENIERPIVEATKISPSPIGVYNAGSHESEICPGENLFNQPKILVTCDSNEAVGSQEIRETMDKPLIQSDQHAQKLTTTEKTGTKERQETIDQMPLVQPTQKHIEFYHNLENVNETIEKPLIQTSQQTQRPAGGHDIGESHESKTCPNKDSFNHHKTFVTRDKKENIHDTMYKPLIQADQDAKKLATIQSTEESSDSYTRTQKICNTIKKASISAAQDVSNSTMIPEAVIDPSPSQAPEPVVSPTEKLNIYRNYMEMIDISKQNMPYLEAGVNRHPQVLDWLNTKPRRVFASSIFSLFAEVTRNLRTTRKGHLTEDDRSYIRKCCNVLEAADFDVSWLSYVHKCIEECGDAEDVKRKVEETKGQASSLEVKIESMKEELASVKESLVLLLDKARNLDDFIES
ncbi:hypothetical protein K1719_045950 [Acacia pycnantha]|nr:hypothetical protein K1719_045950 [Acacia pycnantha]